VPLEKVPKGIPRAEMHHHVGEYSAKVALRAAELVGDERLLARVVESN